MTSPYLSLLTEGALNALVLPLSQDATFFAMKSFSEGAPGLMVACAAAGATLGHGVNYALGRALAWAREQEHIYVKDELYAKAARIARRFLWPLLLVTWAGLGGLIPLAAGFFKASPAKTLALVLLGQAGYYAVMYMR